MVNVVKFNQTRMKKKVYSEQSSFITITYIAWICGNHVKSQLCFQISNY